ncbi:unnamed protein product [Choristocarpus tenellus]
MAKKNKKRRKQVLEVRKREKEKPQRFEHPRLTDQLNRARRAWLRPEDPLYKDVLACSYRGLHHLPASSLPPDLHSRFHHAFENLYKRGLFLYDTVQAGGKRLSRTFVTRTLLGDCGITYKYLGLRLFSHPWDSGIDSSKGPGNGLVAVVNDPCMAGLWGWKIVNDGAGEGGSSIAADMSAALMEVGKLSQWMRQKATTLLEQEEDESSGRRLGSCDFNLTLINRMESSAVKHDLKQDPLFGMGKCSVSWHADSCLEDFSTIGVYHCTDPVLKEPDWGIALRVSQEVESGGDKGRVKEKEEVAEEENGDGSAKQEVLTPPLLVPLASGDAYFMLDDFNHFHEHAVVAGSTLRYSSTHRVSVTEGNTFSGVQKRCEEVLARGGGGYKEVGGNIIDVAQVRKEQALLTGLESEWINQFWVQGARHAALHPWWRGPMALILATWRELESRTCRTIQRLCCNTEHFTPVGTTTATVRAFETMLRALEERKNMREKWDARFTNKAYRSLPPDSVPVPPALWSASDQALTTSGGSASSGDDNGIALLPKDLNTTIVRLREAYADAYRRASGGRKAGSGKAIAAGAASNWELFLAKGQQGQGLQNLQQGEGTGTKTGASFGSRVGPQEFVQKSQDIPSGFSKRATRKMEAKRGRGRAQGLSRGAGSGKGDSHESHSSKVERKHLREVCDSAVLVGTDTGTWRKKKRSRKVQHG